MGNSPKPNELQRSIANDSVLGSISSYSLLPEDQGVRVIKTQNKLGLEYPEFLAGMQARYPSAHDHDGQETLVTISDSAEAAKFNEDFAAHRTTLRPELVLKRSDIART